MHILVYLDWKNDEPTHSGLEALGAAQQHGDKITAAVIGQVKEESLKTISADQVYSVEIEDAQNHFFKLHALVLAQIIEKTTPDAVFISATPAGKEIAARLAAKFQTDAMMDAVQITKQQTDIAAVRPVYSGAILEQIQMQDSSKIVALRPGSFAKAERKEYNPIIIKEKCSIDLQAKIEDVVLELQESNLESADIIVAGGRGMENKEQFALLTELAELLGGAIGATRPAIENGWISKQHQVGQSGKIVAPKLYIACGISGAMQHISGMKDAKYIVAINRDEDAPIFDIADLGIVGDVKNILPLLINEIKQHKKA